MAGMVSCIQWSALEQLSQWQFQEMQATISFTMVGTFCFKVKRNWCCALPEVDEEQGWEEALADEGAAPEGG